MEYNYRGVNNQTPPNPNPPYVRPPPNYFHLAEQAPLRSKNYTSIIGRPVIRTPMDVQREAMIRRQIEKDRIREEIIAAEIARRRELEAEVRRELMLERQFEFRRREADELPFQRARPPSPFSTTSHQRRHHQWEEADAGSLEKRIASSFEERVARTGFGGFEIDLPFQRMVQPRISQVDRGDSTEADKVISKAMPDASLSGTKRKAVTPPTVGAGFLPLIGWKKPKEEWSCVICHVNATSEQGLNDHLRGKRHKSKEAKLKAQQTGKIFSTGLCSTKTLNPTQPAEVAENSVLEQVGKIKGKSLKFNRKGGSSVPNIQRSDEVPTLHQEEDTSNSKKNGVPPVQKMKKKPENKKKKFKFWCEMCQTGAFSEEVMNNHKKGKKHVFRLKELEKNEAVPLTTQMVGVALKTNEGVVEDEEKGSLEAVCGTVFGSDSNQASGELFKRMLNDEAI